MFVHFYDLQFVLWIRCFDEIDGGREILIDVLEVLRFFLVRCMYNVREGCRIMEILCGEGHFHSLNDRR